MCSNEMMEFLILIMSSNLISIVRVIWELFLIWIKSRSLLNKSRPATKLDSMTQILSFRRVKIFICLLVRNTNALIIMRQKVQHWEDKCLVNSEEIKLSNCDQHQLVMTHILHGLINNKENVQDFVLHCLLMNVSYCHDNVTWCHDSATSVMTWLVTWLNTISNPEFLVNN